MYRWEGPHEWLNWAVNNQRFGVGVHALLDLIHTYVDGDDIQFQFQDLMDRDGYFEEEPDAGSR